LGHASNKQVVLHNFVSGLIHIIGNPTILIGNPTLRAGGKKLIFYVARKEEEKRERSNVYIAIETLARNGIKNVDKMVGGTCNIPNLV
jgi:hypothetical protein